jgi:hypothetical protein
VCHKKNKFGTVTVVRNASYVDTVNYTIFKAACLQIHANVKENVENVFESKIL